MPKTCPGAKITSMATIYYINQLLFHRPSSVIFQWVYGPQLQRVGRSALEITELLCCEFRYRHRHFQVLEGPKIAIMIVPHGINRPLSSCLFNVRAHTGLKSLTREHEGTLTQTELAIIMQIPLSAKPWFPPVGGIFGAGGTPLGKCRTPFRLIKINWGFCFIKAPELNAWAGGAAQNCGV